MMSSQHIKHQLVGAIKCPDQSDPGYVKDINNEDVVDRSKWAIQVVYVYTCIFTHSPSLDFSVARVLYPVAIRDNYGSLLALEDNPNLIWKSKKKWLKFCIFHKQLIVKTVCL